jgi:hypothetical protein
LTTKIHLAVDGRGRPVRVILTPGQCGDAPQAREILRAVVHEFADCELTVGGPLPDSIELALRNILVLLDRLDPAAGEAVRS